MKFATRSTMRNWISSSRKATTATGAAVYVEVDDVQGVAALTLRSAGVSTSLQMTAEEALSIAAELMQAATLIGSDARISPSLPEVRNSTLGEFDAVRWAR